MTAPYDVNFGNFQSAVTPTASDIVVGYQVSNQVPVEVQYSFAQIIALVDAQADGRYASLAALASPTGAALVGYAASTLDVILSSALAKVVTSVANLRSIDKTKYTETQVQGYYAQGDGGGGSYYYDPADTTSADNGGTIIVGADGGRWKLNNTLQVSARQFGAKGDGVTDDTAAVTLALATRINGQTLFFPAGTYNINGSFTTTKSVSILGAGKGTVFNLASTSPNILFYLGGAVANGTPDPNYPGTVFNFGTGALTAGQTVFTFASTTGLAVGDEVMLNMGIDPIDLGQHFSRSFNKIAAISGNTVTMEQGIPEVVAAFPATPGFSFSPTFNECIKFTNGIVENITVGNFSVTQVAGTITDPLIMIFRARKPVVKDIYLNLVKNSIYFQECDNPVLDGIYAKKCLGSFATFAGCNSIYARNLKSQRNTGVGLYFENQNRVGTVDGVSLTGDATKGNNGYFSVLGGSKGISIKNFEINNVAVPNAQALIIDATSDVITENVTLNTLVNVFPLKQHIGSISYGGFTYKNIKRHRLVISLQPSMSFAEFQLPNGFTKSVKVKIQSRTGVSRIVLVNNDNKSAVLIDTANSVDVMPANGVFGPLTNDFSTTIGTDIAFGFNANPLNKRVQITTDTTCASATSLSIETETFVSYGDDGVNGEEVSGQLADYFGNITVTFPTIPAGGQQSVNVSVIGASVGSPCFAGYTQYLQGCTISAIISSNGTAEVIVRNGTAAAVTLASGTMYLKAFRL